MSVLDEIVEKRKEFFSTIANIQPSRKNNGDFLSIFTSFAVIAECKWRSPSEGYLVENYDPVAMALAYVDGGADAISVLTEPDFFSGSFMHLMDVAHHVTVPVLCKDVVVDERQIYLANKCGASACLLMVACLSDERLAELYACALDCQLTPVIEVFNEEEIRRALVLNPRVIQINNRNLGTMDVDTSRSEQLCRLIPEGVHVIAASGVKRPEEVSQYPSRIDAVLIGTALMRSTDPAQFVKTIKASAR